jgi:hypothetical protein
MGNRTQSTRYSMSGQSHVKLHGSPTHWSFESIIPYLWTSQITYEIKDGL